MQQRAGEENNPYAPPLAEVRDATVATASRVHATRSGRFIAAVVDGLLLGALPGALFGASMPLWLGDAAMRRALEANVWSALPIGALLLGAAGLIAMVAVIVVNIILVSRHGQTIGKRWLGIKVVRLDGSRASLGRIFWLRNVVNALPGLIPLIGFVYVLVDHCLIFGEQRRCLHDLIADTRVVVA